MSDSSSHYSSSNPPRLARLFRKHVSEEALSVAERHFTTHYDGYEEANRPRPKPYSDEWLVYTLLSMVEHECFRTGCVTAVRGATVETFLLSQAERVREVVEQLPDRGAIPMTSGSLQDIYPRTTGRIHTELPQQRLEANIDAPGSHHCITGYHSESGEVVEVGLLYPTADVTGSDGTLAGEPAERLANLSEGQQECVEGADVLVAVPRFLAEFQRTHFFRAESSPNGSGESSPDVVLGFVSSKNPLGSRERLRESLGGWRGNGGCD